MEQSLLPQGNEVRAIAGAIRTRPKYHNPPAAADIAFCVAAFASEMAEDRMVRAPEDDYLSRELG